MDPWPLDEPGIWGCEVDDVVARVYGSARGATQVEVLLDNARSWVDVLESGVWVFDLPWDQGVDVEPWPELCNVAYPDAAAPARSRRSRGRTRP